LPRRKKRIAPRSKKSAGPRVATDPGKTKKQPLIGADPDFLGGSLCWRFSSADIGGPFSWKQLPNEKYREVLEKLHEFETMDWQNIRQAGNHSVECGNCSKSARDRLAEIERDDLDELMSFRITGRRRVWCVLEGSLARVLWWDPNHEVCPSKLKGT